MEYVIGFFIGIAVYWIVTYQPRCDVPDPAVLNEWIGKHKRFPRLHELQGMCNAPGNTDLTKLPPKHGPGNSAIKKG